uniref:Uncharacterized protein LOC100178786 n=1 Tax=Phallusia mammillata TaxID=59560 RepID=A0A6F9DGY5_9ASCI|nr:uncharacterized protein LOC100178786 [Phallusia mammillata]
MSVSNSKNANAKLMSQRIRIKAKLEGLKAFHKETFDAFQTKLDDITLTTLNKGMALLSASQEDVMEKAPDILDAIDGCNEKLIAINLMLCESNFSEIDGENESKSTVKDLKKEPMPLKNPQVTTKTMQDLETSSDDTHSYLFNDSICDIQSSIENLRTDKFASNPDQLSSVEPVTSCDTISCSPSLHLSSLNTNLDQSKRPNVPKSVLDYCDNDCMEIVVCDVSSPSRFSVQLMNWMEILISLQQDINDFYSGSRQNRIEDRFYIGMICVAIFPCDQCWYRAEIQEILPNFSYKVYYIDYGNTAEVKHENLRKITRDFEEIPKLAVNCKLHGIIPKTAYRKWTPQIIIWFNQFVYGKKFMIKFHGRQDVNHTEKQSVSLFDVSENDTFWNVSTSMIYLGLAMAKEKCSCCYPDEKEETFEKQKDINMVNLNTPQQCELNKPQFLSVSNTAASTSSSRTNSHSRTAKSEGFVSPYGNNFDESTSHINQWQVSPKPRRSLSYVEYLESQSNSGCQVFEALRRSCSDKKQHALSSHSKQS